MIASIYKIAFLPMLWPYTVEGALALVNKAA